MLLFEREKIQLCFFLKININSLFYYLQFLFAEVSTYNTFPQYRLELLLNRYLIQSFENHLKTKPLRPLINSILPTSQFRRFCYRQKKHFLESLLEKKMGWDQFVFQRYIIFLYSVKDWSKEPALNMPRGIQRTQKGII